MGLYPPRVSSNPPVVTRRYDTVEFFVDGSNGSDDGARPGDRPEKPLATIAEAIDRCNSGEQNIINVIAPGHVGEANPIVVDKQFVTIRGWPSQNPGGSSPCTLVSTVADSYFTVAAQDVVIRDFTIHANAAHPAIDFETTAYSYRCGIHGVTFKAGTWGVVMGEDVGDSAADAPSHHWAITNCIFTPTLSGGGIYLDSNGSWGLIKDNYFESVPYGIYMPHGSQNLAGRILNNHFMLPSDDVVGRAIWIGNGVSRWIIQDNYANDATKAVSTNNPFSDSPDTNFWVNNYGSAPAAGAELVPV